MIISRTPFRISFVGGGTDLADFYTKEPGNVVSTTINKYMYITIHKSFDDEILLKYSSTEKVLNVEEIQHPLFRECMKLTGVTKGVVITSIADIPGGTGLGSSSSFTIGLLNALYAYKGKHVSAERLAREASQIEIDILKEPIGKQDQYIVAYGGLNNITFNPDGNVIMEKLFLSAEIKKKLSENLLLFYTGITRDARSILSEQKEKTKKHDTFSHLKEMRDLSIQLKEELLEGNIDLFGEFLNKGWLFKKQLTDKISHNSIDEIYDEAMENGAEGGKLLGAGGGGFLLFYCQKKNQDKLRKALSGLKEVNFKMNEEGSRIIYVVDNDHTV